MEDQVPNVRSDWAWVAAAPLGCPVVPEVKMRSDTSSGRDRRRPRRGVAPASTRSPAARNVLAGRGSGTAGRAAARGVALVAQDARCGASAPVSSPASMAG